MYWNYEKVEEQLHIDRFYSFFEERYEHDYTFTGEAHDFWECVCVLEGEICVSADEKIYNLKKGEVIFHAPLEFHKFYINSKGGAHLLIFSFSLEGKFAELFRHKIVTLSKTEEENIKLLLSYTRSNSKGDSDGYWQMVRSYVYLLLLSFAKHKTTVATSTEFDSTVYQKAICYMADNICKKVSISEIAAVCNVGTTFLKSTFKKYSGLSVHQYFLKLKMRMAVELLKSGQNVTEVAMYLGFGSQPYFSAAFKREIGEMPSAFQKK